MYLQVLYTDSEIIQHRHLVCVFIFCLFVCFLFHLPLCKLNTQAYKKAGLIIPLAGCPFKPLGRPAQRTVQSGTAPAAAHAPEVAAADSSSSSDSAAQGNGRKSVRFKTMATY